MNKVSKWALGILLAAGTAHAAYAYSVIGRYDHGTTVQVELRCDSGSKSRVTYYKKTGKYCTSAMSCDASLAKAARWACGE